MTLGKDRWHAISPSAYEWEREALDFIRNRLPDTDPYRAWANFEFVTPQGAIYEVDLLVLTKNGLFFVEVKSRPGRVRGDANTWKWEKDREPRDNPLILANRKAKALKSLIEGRRGAWKKARCPFIETLVFLSAEDNWIELDEVGRTRVVVRDQPGEDLDTTKRPTIFRALLRGEGPGLEHRRPPIDRRVAQALEQAMSEIGVRPSRRAYRVGEYELESDPEGEGPGWQDFIGKHQSITGDYVRARRYLVAAAIRDDEQRWLRRAAEREYRVLCALRHPSILQAKQFVDHELGPTLLFEWRDGTRRLDLFIAESGSRLAIGSKLDILRRLADALRYAHRKNVVHRALSPKCVLIENPEAVIERGADPELRVAGWQVALRLESIDSASTYTRHIEEFTEASDRIYLAPELRRDPERARGASVDVFSLGALSFLVLAGRPPAASDRELDRLLRERGALDLAAVVDGVGTSLRDLVLYSTSADPSSRFETADEFLEQLGDVEEELTAPPSEDFIDPLEAKQGNVLKAPELLRTPYEAGFRVETVLGRGSTAIALAVRRLDGEGRANGNGKRNGNGKGNEGGNGNESLDASPPPSGKSSAGQPLVLKVALDESRSDALRGEADALRLLRHDCIVGLVDELVLCQRTALLLEHAGDSTLRDLLRAERSLSLDYLHRYGEELLRAVLHLEEKGVPHRDIKPDNIAIQTAGKRRYRLVLFDFSLSRAARDDIGVGTPGYIDPFLELRPGKAWDPAADRWAAAVTLHEMAVGHRPGFGDDGRADPLTTDAHARLEPEKFDSSVREGLTRFFERAFSRKVEDRHDGAEEMLSDWQAVFAGGDRGRKHKQAVFDLGAIQLEDPIQLLELSTRAVNVLDRRNVVRVRDLLQFPLRKLIFLRGVGKKTRDELVACVKELRRRFPAVEEQLGVASVEEPSPADDDAKTGEGELVLDAIYRRIVGRPPAKKGGELRFEVRRSLLADDREATFPEDWFPTHGELAERHRCSTARVGQILADERVRWGKDSRMRELRERFAESLRSAAGVFTLAEATDAVLSLVDAGGANTPEVRLRAVAVVRALVEAESTSESPRFDAFRSRDRVFIAVARPFVAWAVALGDEADDIARADPLLAPERAIERLRLIALSDSPAGGFGVEVSIADDERLLRLAASVGTIAELSARREIYPRDMPADRALKLGAGALSGLGVGASEVEGGATARLDLRPGEFDPEEVRQRIRARYPKARELPQPTELDRLLREVGIDVEWDAARGVYRRAATHALVTTSGRSPLPRRLPTLPPRERREIAPEVAEARQFEELLRDRYERGSFLVLTVSEHEMVPCGEELHRRFNEGGRTLERVSLDREILRAMREVVRRENFDWNVVREVDRAGPSSREWLDLVDIAKAAIVGDGDSSDAVLPRLLRSETPLLLVYPGLLARFDRMDVIEKLRDEAGRQGRVRVVWILVAADDQQTQPRLDGKEIPLLTTGQSVRVPTAWIRNEHRSDGRRS